jgi:uncharacterized repeat protein (TIGR03803 family)
MRWLTAVLTGCSLTTCVSAQYFRTIYSFDATIGAAPFGNLIQGPDGTLYGTTSLGGGSKVGSIFRITPDGVPTKLHEFSVLDGCYPVAGLVLAPDGNFYGTTRGQGSNTGCVTEIVALSRFAAVYGSVFQMKPDGTTNPLHVFDSTVVSGPVTKLAVGTDGYLYGSTGIPGSPGEATMFRVLPSGQSFSTLLNYRYSFFTELLRAADGNFYTEEGTQPNPTGSPTSAVYGLTPLGQTAFGVDLNTATAGFIPVAGLIQGPDGNFYGTTTVGGPLPGASGAIFRVTPGGVVTNLHTFTGADGGNPKTPLLWASDGNIYGTTSTGGLSGGGTLFRLTPTGVFSVLKNFGGATGTNPQGLTQASDGALYGVTPDGGKNGLGTVFKWALVPTPPDQLGFTDALRVAQIADGGSWQTSFQIVNLDSGPVSYAIRFWDDNGRPLQLPLANGSLSGILQAGAAVLAQTSGTAPALSQGWAEVASSGRIGVLVIFKQAGQGRPDSEGTVAGTASGDRIFVPFDNTNGYVTGIAVANTNATQPLTISLIFQLENGLQGSGTLTLPPHAHTAFALSANFPALAGAQGSVEFTAPSADMTVVGLRFSPSGSFTSLGAFQ